MSIKKWYEIEFEIEWAFCNYLWHVRGAEYKVHLSEILKEVNIEYGTGKNERSMSIACMFIFISASSRPYLELKGCWLHYDGSKCEINNT